MSDQPKSKRTFSKRMMAGNLAAAWALIFISAYMGTLALVLPQALGFIGVLISIYTGVGHLDFRKVLDTTSPVVGGGK